MKCSHGLDFEMKCFQCFEEGMERNSASRAALRPAVVKPEADEDLFLLGDIQPGVDTDPRPL